MPRKAKKAGRPSVPRPILFLLAALVLVIVYRLVAPGQAHAHEHPQPRAGVTAEKVVSGQRYSEYADVAETYEMARQIPYILDGLHCYCECEEHSGHYSLLSCFESDHGAGCDICLDSAAMAYRMHQEGASLDQIRAQVDAAYANMPH